MMRALLFNAKNFAVKFDSLANRPKTIVHEDLNGKEKQKCFDCVVAKVYWQNRVCKIMMTISIKILFSFIKQFRVSSIFTNYFAKGDA